MEELKLQTPVETGRSKVGVSLNDKIVILGSCFADNMGQKMVDPVSTSASTRSEHFITPSPFVTPSPA